MEIEKKRSGDEDLSLLLHKQGCLIQILVWLPVVSLLRFKAVCKSWRDLIQSPSFIHLHTPITLNSSSSKFGSFIVHVLSGEDEDEDGLLMLSSPYDEDGLLMLSSPYEPMSGGGSGEEEEVVMDDLGFDMKSKEIVMSGGGSEEEEEEEEVVMDDLGFDMKSKEIVMSGGGSGEEEEEEEEEMDDLGFYMKSKEIVMSGGGSGEEEVVVDDLGFDMNNKEIVGSCNGLVCVRDKEQTLSESINLYLWNPATGQGVDVPKSKTIPGDIFSLVAFGFDVETKDYKVVQFTGRKQTWNGNGSLFCFCRVQVYSLSTQSWRLLEHMPCLPGYPFGYEESGVVYLNGTCFFLAHFFYTRRYPCLAENNRFIISFDFTKEILTPIQLPEHHRDQELCLCSLGDKIALFTSTTPPSDVLYPLAHPADDAQIFSCQDFNIWVLNYERGSSSSSSSSSSSVTKESWTKLHSFQLQLESPFDWKWYIPSGISNDGKFALLISGYGDKMNLYNFATKEVKPYFLSGRIVMSKAHAYKLSLVSVIDGNGAGSSSSRYGD